MKHSTIILLSVCACEMTGFDGLVLFPAINSMKDVCKVIRNFQENFESAECWEVKLCRKSEGVSESRWSKNDLHQLSFFI